jgi:hypothetical protein
MSTTSTQSELTALAAELAAAKAAETAANAARIEIEQRIVALVEPTDKGTTSVKVPGMTISVVTGYSYKADIPEIKKIFPEIIKTKEELDTKNYEICREKDPALFAQVAKFVTITPKKPAVTIKLS